MKNKIEHEISAFLGNRINSFLIDILLYGMICYMVLPYFNMIQILILTIILILLSVKNMLINVAKGMMMATLHREFIDETLQQLSDDENDDS